MFTAKDEKSTVKQRKQTGAINPLLPVVFGVIALAAVGVTPRLQNHAELSRVHEQLEHSVPQLNAVIAKSAPATEEIVLPGDLQPIQNIPIYARANGYLVNRFVDIGDNVKAGQVLATIDTPELDQQVQQAIANVSAAQATLASTMADRENFAAQLFTADAAIKQSRTNLEFSTSELKRFKELASEGAVSYEQRDQALQKFNSDSAGIEMSEHNRQSQLAQVASAGARLAAAKQAVESAQASLRQLKALQGFQKVTAPSDGVITNRFVDAGSLVAAGGSSGTTELLTMARTDTLRIYVDVPQSDYRYIHTNDHPQIILQEFPGQAFTGTVTNIAGSLSSNSRTLQTEIRLDNMTHILKPGSYAEVHFHYANVNPPVIVPSNATITKNDGLYVAVVQNGKVQYRRVEVARDFGNKVEVSSGLNPNDVVVVDMLDGINAGTPVAAHITKSI